MQKNNFVEKKKRTKLENERTFYGLSASRFVSLVEFAILMVQKSNFRYYFLQKSIFLNASMLGAKIVPSTDDFFQQSFSKTGFTRPGTFWDEAFFWNFFCSFFKNKGYLWKNFLFMSKIPSRRSKLQSKCPEEHSPEKCFWKTSSQEAVGPKNSNYWPKVSSGLSKQHSTPPQEQSVGGKNFTISFVSILVFGLGMWIFEFWFRIQA